jgi:hypothetical protein
MEREEKPHCSLTGIFIPIAATCDMKFRRHGLLPLYQVVSSMAFAKAGSL